MLFRKMPKNGDDLSILGFGCMRMAMKDGVIDQKRAISQIRYAVDHGVNYFDTAWPYHGGGSEPLLKKALAGGYREKVKIATKLPSWLIKSRKDMDDYLDAQLNKLGTDHIDYYLAHALSGAVWKNLETVGVMDFFDAVKADGRITNCGFSFHGLLEDFKKIVEAYPWDFCQIQYNFLDQELQAGTEGLEFAAERGLGVIIMEPLRGGNLAIEEPPAEVKKIWKKSSKKRTPVEWALGWIWNRPEVTVILSGMNEEAHIVENLRIAETAYPDIFSEEELALVDKVAKKYRQLMKVGCTGCGYCLPCPENVMIPGCFEVYNKMHMFNETKSALFSYAVRMGGDIAGGDPGFASQCIQCGECLEKCPQNLSIPKILEAVTAEMEGPGLQDRINAAVAMLKADKA